MKPSLSIGLGLEIRERRAELVAAVTWEIGSHHKGKKRLSACDRGFIFACRGPVVFLPHIWWQRWDPFQALQ